MDSSKISDESEPLRIVIDIKRNVVTPYIYSPSHEPSPEQKELAQVIFTSIQSAVLALPRTTHEQRL